MTKVYCDYHPNIGAKKYLLYVAASVPPLIEGYLRLKALGHFPSDVGIGLALGSVIGILIPELHKNKYNKQLSFSMFTTPNETGLSIRWKLPS